MAASLKTHAGIDVNMGKCRVWSKTGGEAPPGIVSELGPDVWRGDREPEENGLVVLGAPLGTDEFVDAPGSAASTFPMTFPITLA